jgi:precorrin-2 dehydrogenase/sirohydrochlorin ferrochelatase
LVLDPAYFRCLVVGAGEVGTRRTETLLDAGATVVVVSCEFSERFENLRRQRGAELRIRQGECVESDFDGVDLAVIAVTSRTDAARLSLMAHDRGALVCCSTDATLGNLSFPASFSSRGLTVSVSSGGRDPRSARDLRDSLRELLERETSIQLQSPPTE